MFNQIPDVLTVKQVADVLMIGKSSAYNLLRSNRIRHVRVGTKYLVPKQSVIDFLSGVCYNDDQITGGKLQTVTKGETL